jgi:uncharacterized membrane protein YkoI
VRLLLILMTSLVLTAAPATAQEFDPADGIRIAQNNGMSLSEAVESVRSSTDGRIVSAETRTKNGREVHHIKVLTPDGKVKTHKIQGRKRDNG